jgi:dTDP-4-dehydrorhamnose 3,5-epimerase
MKARQLSIEGLTEILPERFGDHRGHFAEVFRQDWFDQHVAETSFVQQNQSLSREAGTLRGLHCQIGTHAQGKLVHCLSGAIFDVAVDVRKGSPSYGTWLGVELSADKGNQLWIPPGFLHGFCTLTPSALVSYMVTSYYSPQHERGVIWNDEDVAIRWPEILDRSCISSKDSKLPHLRDISEDLQFDRVHT